MHQSGFKVIPVSLLCNVFDRHIESATRCRVRKVVALEGMHELLKEMWLLNLASTYSSCILITGEMIVSSISWFNVMNWFQGNILKLLRPQDASSC